MKNLKLGPKILLSFALAIALAAAVAGVSFYTTSEVSSAVHDLAENKIPSTQALAAVDEAQTAVWGSVNALVNRTLATSELHRKAYDNLDAAWKRMDEGWKAFDGLAHAPETEQRWKELGPAWAAWRHETEAVIELVKERDRVVAAGASLDDPRVQQLERRAAEAVVAMQRGFERTTDDLRKVGSQVRHYAVAQQAKAFAAASRASWALAITLAVGAALLLAIGWFFSRSISRVVAALNAEARKLSEAVARGDLAVRGDAASINHEFRGIVDGMNQTMDAFARPIRVTAEYVDRIAKGDLPPKITDAYAGDFNAIKQNLNTCIETLSALIAEMNRMAAEHDRGDIDVAIDPKHFEGAYRVMAEGVNGMVSGHVAVKRKAMACVAEFGKGNFDAPLEQLPGKKAFINETIEKVRGNVKGFIAQMKQMSAAHDAGDIDAAIDAGRLEGDFRAMAEGVNGMVNGHIAVKKKAMACVAEFGKGNFEAPLERFPGKKAFINETIEQVRRNLQALIADADGLAKAAVAGQLSTRADASRHHGDFRRIVEGVNSTLDAVLGPIHEASEVLEKLSQRDLRARVKGAYQGDHARIKDALNATAEALHEAMAQVAEAVGQVSSAAGQIAASSQAVADGASEQASSLEETTSSLESMATMTKQASDNAQQANGLAQAAKAAAAEGGVAMEQMSGAMGKIKASAEGTSQIIKDINEIAFQTNLLALNAAVEAARAGEAGRGFAVVAEEVRSLALRSKEAAMKTEELIRQSVREAGEGEVTAKHVNEKLSEIAGGVGKVTDIVAEIAAAAKEQATGIDQITKAMAQMDKVTQQNAANSEESSSAAAELSGQSEELAAMVGSFQLARAASAMRAPATAATAARPAAKPAGKPGKAVAPARTGGKNGAAGHSSIPVRPEELIPLEGDVFKDF